jgi:carbamoyltransferase
MEPWVLGIGGSHHNGSACLLHGERIVAAIQEERLVGIKRYPLAFGADSLAVRYCLNAAGITVRDLDLIVCCPTAWSRQQCSDVLSNPFLAPLRNKVPVLYVQHHLAHAAGAYATSGFRDAAILVVDGMGSPFCDLSSDERRVVKSGLSAGSEAHSFYCGVEGRVRPLEKHLIDEGRWRCYASSPGPVDFDNPYPLAPLQLSRGPRKGMRQFYGLGHMYDRVGTQIFGNPLEGPGKVMGLAPYGRPSFAPEEFFSFSGGTFEFLPTVPNAFPYEEIWPNRQREYRDLAAATQKAFEVGMLHLVAHLRGLHASENLVLAGGCALNSVANRRIHAESGYRNIYIIPAAEDSGVSIGAAYLGYWELTGPSVTPRLKRDSLGRTYSRSEVDDALSATPMIETVETSDPVGSAIDLLTSGKIVALFQGGSELGPRALGQRSILCDPRRPDAKQFLNQKVKFREDFRPFAPAILRSEVSSWFETGGELVDCAFMLRVLAFREERKSQVPAVVHEDGTGRLQTLSPEEGGLLYELVCAMFERTGVPILLNTSFNLQSEPIVETPEDALWTLLLSGLDACLFEGKLVRKRDEAWSPLQLEVRRSAELVEKSDTHFSLVTRRPFLATWERPVRADSMDYPVLRAILGAADRRPTAMAFLAHLRTQFGGNAGKFLPRRDEHALGLMRRSGLIELAWAGR